MLASSRPVTATPPATAGGDRWVRLALLALVFAAAQFQISTYDVWWHLAYGRWMAAHHAIPRVDDFSFTLRGAPRVDHEWLFQLLVYGLWRLGGPALLVLAKTIGVTAVAAVVLRFVERESELAPVAAAAFLLPFLLGGVNRYVVRPELVSVALAVVVCVALFRRRARPAGWRELWWVPALFVLWANAHAGVVFGLVLLWAAVAGAGLAHLARWSVPSRHRFAVLAPLAALSTAATLVNPWGAAVLRVAFELTRWHASGVFLNAEWQVPDPRRYWLAWLAMALALAVALCRGRRTDLAALLPLLATVAVGLRYVRNVGLACLLAPVLAVAASGGGGAVLASIGSALRRVRPALAAALLGLLAAVFLVGRDPFPAGFGVNRGRLPVAAVDYLERAHPGGRMLDAHPYGGYLIWRLYPRQRVFIDGRDDLYHALRPRLQRAATDSRAWFSLLDDEGIGYAVLQYLPQLQQVRTPGGDGRRAVVRLQPFGASHFPVDDWALVYFDDLALVFVRRTPANAELIARDEYRHVRPESVRYQLQEIADGHVSAAGALDELARTLRRDPGCQRAQRLRAAILALRDRRR